MDEDVDNTAATASAATTKNVTGWVDAFIRDDMAKDKEPFQPPYKFTLLLS